MVHTTHYAKHMQRSHFRCRVTYATLVSTSGGGKTAAVGGEGCNINGELKVKKVPGSLHIKLTSPRYDVDASLINASHQVDAQASPLRY